LSFGAAERDGSCFGVAVGSLRGVMALLLVVVVGMEAVPTAAGAQAGSASVRVSSLRPGPIPRGAKALGDVAANRTVRFDVVVAPPDPARISTLLAGLYDRAPRRSWLYCVV